MKKKLDEYRKRIREEQIAERKSSIRWSMIEAINREDRAEELDASLRMCIEEYKGREFIELYASADKDAVFSLPRMTIEEGYLCFSDDPTQDHHAAIVKELLVNHAPILLVSSRMQQSHNKIIAWSIKEINQIVQTNHEDIALLV